MAQLSGDPTWVPPVNIIARQFGNCWEPLGSLHLFLPQLPNCVLQLYVFNPPIFMARLPLPLLGIG